MSRKPIAVATLLMLLLANAATGEEMRRPSHQVVAPISASIARHARMLAAQRTEQPDPDSCHRRRMLKGAAIGAAAGAVLGVLEANLSRDCGTCGTTYVRSGVVFGAIGAGIGAAVGALAGRGCGP